ncbi:MAG TPA: LLM class flavin-dependent oxidoreductase [Longimicrobiales bacterium]|nr:LLM class flavin-dependent oxidoreductase [Longimicrobiales bacterium]
MDGRGDRCERVPLKLSVLDVLPVPSGTPPGDVLGRAGDLASLADRLGYERIWYAEHHGMGGIAATSPDLLIAHVAPLTERVRVGAGGVMIPNHAPLQVVERYRTLEALHPGRIDLGIGRAPGTDPLTSQALRAAPGQYTGELIGELLAFAHGAFPADHPFGRIRVAPAGVPLPPVWLLGSSGASAEMAGRLGTGYAFAAHFSPTPAAPAIRAYRESFTPSADFPEPRAILALSVVCAETAAGARELSSSIEVHFQRIRAGETGPVPSPAEARALGWSPDAPRAGPMAELLVAGTPEAVRAEIETRAAEAGADEVMIMTIVHDHAARLRSYELVAGAFATG